MFLSLLGLVRRAAINLRLRVLILFWQARIVVNQWRLARIKRRLPRSARRAEEIA